MIEARKTPEQIEFERILSPVFSPSQEFDVKICTYVWYQIATSCQSQQINYIVECKKTPAELMDGWFFRDGIWFPSYMKDKQIQIAGKDYEMSEHLKNFIQEYKKRMSPKTGTVTVTNGDKKIVVPAKKSCRKCYGRGHIGTDPMKQAPDNKVICSCVVKNYARIAPPEPPSLTIK